MPVVCVVATRMNTSRLGQILCSGNKLLLNHRFSALKAIIENRSRASHQATASPLASRYHRRGTLTA
jgi:hypothetical protein